MSTLDPTKVTVSVGSRYITGFAPDGIFSLVWNADRVTLTVGSQGDTTYVENADNSAILALTLSPTSPSVEHLEDLCARRTEVDVNVSDASKDARKTYFSQGCRVQKFADVVRNTQAPTNTWAIILPNVQKV